MHLEDYFFIQWNFLISKFWAMHIWSDASFVFSFTLHDEAVFLAVELLGKLRYIPFFSQGKLEIRMFGYTNIHLEVQKK